MSDITGNAFITTRKGVCYLTIKIGRRNHHMMKVRQYKIERGEKHDMRRLYSIPRLRGIGNHTPRHCSLHR